MTGKCIHDHTVYERKVLIFLKMFISEFVFPSTSKQVLLQNHHMKMCSQNRFSLMEIKLIFNSVTGFAQALVLKQTGSRLLRCNLLAGEIFFTGIVNGSVTTLTYVVPKCACKVYVFVYIYVSLSSSSFSVLSSTLSPSSSSSSSST